MRVSEDFVGRVRHAFLLFRQGIYTKNILSILYLGEAAGGYKAVKWYTGFAVWTVM